MLIVFQVVAHLFKFLALKKHICGGDFNLCCSSFHFGLNKD